MYTKTAADWQREFGGSFVLDQNNKLVLIRDFRANDDGEIYCRFQQSKGSNLSTVFMKNISFHPVKISNMLVNVPEIDVISVKRRAVRQWNLGYNSENTHFKSGLATMDKNCSLKTQPGLHSGLLWDYGKAILKEEFPDDWSSVETYVSKLGMIAISYEFGIMLNPSSIDKTYFIFNRCFGFVGTIFKNIISVMSNNYYQELKDFVASNKLGLTIK